MGHSECRSCLGLARKEAAWIRIAGAGKALLFSNKPKIPDRILNRRMRVMEADSAELIRARQEGYREISFCW